MIPHAVASRRVLVTKMEVTVEYLGRDGQTLVLNTEVPYWRQPIVDEVGLRLTTRGTWESPYMEVGGRWMERPAPAGGGAWELEEPSEDVLLRPVRKWLGRVEAHRKLVERRDDVEDFDAGGFVVIIDEKPWHLPPQEEPVGVQVRAIDTFSGRSLNVDDGIVIFSGIPSTRLDGVEDPVGRLQEDLAHLVRARNGRLPQGTG